MFLAFNALSIFFVFIYKVFCAGFGRTSLSKIFECCFCLCFLVVNSYLISSSSGLIDYTFYNLFYEACHAVDSFGECYAISAGALGSNEFLFVLLVYISVMLGLSFSSFCFVVCLIFLCFMLFAYLRLDKNWFTCFIVLFSTSAIIFLFGNTLRQAVAVPFILLFVSAVDLKRYKEAISFFLMASFFHYSSLLVLLTYLLFCGFLGRASRSVMVCAILLGTAGAVGFYYFYGLDTFTLIVDKFYYYLGNNFNFSNLFSLTFVSGVFFVSVVIYLKIIGLYRYSDGVFLFYFVCVLVSFLFVFNDVIYNRVTLYRTVVEVIVLMRVLMCFSLAGMRSYLLYPFLAGCYLVANFYNSPAYTIFR